MRRVIPAAVLVLLLASCGGERAEAPPPAPSSTPVAAQAAPPPSSAQLTSVSENEGEVTIAFTENGQARELFGEARDTGKRKYSLGDGTVLYEIKPGDGQDFKLRAPDGKLRWKVKVSPDKVKISDNEENRNPFELQVKDATRVKVEGPGERELGNVRFAANRLQVEDASGKVVFALGSMKPSGAYGVLLLDGIPPREQYILVAELLSRGR